MVSTISVLGSWLAPAGPPPVITYTRSKFFKDPTTAKVTQTFRIGFISGMGICNAV